MLLNLLQPTSGKAFVLGVDSRRIGPRELARIGYVSENQDLPDWMTVEQLIAYVRPFYPTWDEALCRKLQRDLDLTSRLPVRLFSRGMRMKAALLVSLAYRPELVLLDEPFSGLDPLARDELVRALLELTGERNWTTLISSHDIDEVERLADSIAFINQGRIFLTDSVQDLVGKYRRPLRDIFVMLARTVAGPVRGGGGCMTLVLHLIRWDIRRFQILLPLWLLLVAASAALEGAWPAMAVAMAARQTVGITGNLLAVAEVLFSVVFIALVVQEHPLVGTTAFWMTRPMPPRALLASKAIL